MADDTQTQRPIMVPLWRILPWMFGLIIGAVGWGIGYSDMNHTMRDAIKDNARMIESNKQSIKQETEGYRIVVQTLVNQFQADLKEVNTRLSRIEGYMQKGDK